MISDRDIWAAALLIVKRYRDGAMREAEARAEQFQEDGDMAGAGDVAPDLERDRAAAG